MNRADNIEQQLTNLKFTPRPDLDERILADASAAMEQARAMPHKPTRAEFWRIIMHKRWTKVAAAAAAVAIVIVGVSLFHGSAVPAYALEQTVEANRLLSFVHVTVEPVDGVSEAWAEFDDQGQPIRLRMEFPQTEDGPKSVVRQRETAEVYFHAKKSHLTCRDPEMVAHFAKMADLFDPRIKIDQLYQDQLHGRVSLQITPSTGPAEPIVLTAISKPNPTRKVVFNIDPTTKFVLVSEKYELKDGEYELQAQFTYSELNEPDPTAFVLKMPKDVVRIDQTVEDIGVLKGDLTNEQIAVKVARDFFEALIARDYAAAGRIFEGIPAVKMEEVFGKMTFLRIVSVGAPTPHPMPATHFLCVPVEVEMEMDGAKLVKKFTPNIRALYNRPDRWVIGGGI